LSCDRQADLEFGVLLLFFPFHSQMSLFSSSVPSFSSPSSVPYTRSLCSRVFQPRQFEYHPSEPILAVGTLDGEVVIVDWENDRIQSKAIFPGHTEQEKSTVLALSWLRKSSDLLLAGCSTGRSALYRIDRNANRIGDEEANHEIGKKNNSVISPRRLASTLSQPSPFSSYFSSSSSPSPLHLEHDFGSLADELTSIHGNCTDEYIATSGYSRDVRLYDLSTGTQFTTLKNIHDSHINIARFANEFPTLLLTCSFDGTVKLWDIRQKSHRSSHNGMEVESSSTTTPIYTVTNTSGNVMVCFSPNDLYFLSSSVDNEIKQYHTVDGRLSLHYTDIPPIGSSTNYSRSYYCNDGAAMISGSSSSDQLFMCCTTTGKRIATIDMKECRRQPNLYIQSLRGCTTQSNRACVLVHYKQSDQPYELIDVDMDRQWRREDEQQEEGLEKKKETTTEITVNIENDETSSKQSSTPLPSSPRLIPRSIPPPFSLCSTLRLSSDLRGGVNSSSFADVILVSCDGHVVFAHQSILMPRWKWLREHTNLEWVQKKYGYKRNRMYISFTWETKIRFIKK